MPPGADPEALTKWRSKDMWALTPRVRSAPVARAVPGLFPAPRIPPHLRLIDKRGALEVALLLLNLDCVPDIAFWASRRLVRPPPGRILGRCPACPARGACRVAAPSASPAAESARRLVWSPW